MPIRSSIFTYRTIAFNSSVGECGLNAGVTSHSLVSVARGEVYHILEKRFLTFSIVARNHWTENEKRSDRALMAIRE
jgi:hypothetical protein